MIESKELRLGNWMLDGTAAKQIKAIHNNYIQFIDESEFVVFPISLDKIQSILITPEILEACGFKKGEINYELKLDMFNISWDTDSFNVYDPDFDTGSGILVFNQNTLHQLQNLHFSLTGKELQIRLREQAVN